MNHAFEHTSVRPERAREQFRAGLSTPTAGWCAGWTQVNLVALPRDWAFDMLLFGQRNPAPVPILDVTDVGSSSTTLAVGADLARDLPRYRVWREGELIDEPTDASEYWREDLVAFLIGCSFSFETALVDAGVPLRHVDQGRNVAMFHTNLACRPAGRLSGNMVVSMRPIPGSLVATAVQVSGAMRRVHGAPVHVGDPAAIGISDVSAPDFGDPVRAEEGDVPVFWACGVTPQAALISSRVPFAITHAPGHMFITDAPDSDYREP